MNNSEFIATGDLGPCRDDARTIFASVRERLRMANFVFGQLEPVLTERGSPAPQARLAMRSSPHTAAAIRDAGFDMISFASNHCMDWGHEGLIDTLAALRAADLVAIGAGENIRAARAPAFFDCGGTRIACLAFNSILPQGYWAEENRAGCAPLRAWTIQEQIEHDQPGIPARVHTFADRNDLQNLIAAILAAKQDADVLMLSLHWGIHFVPKVLAAYQREIAHAAIDAGADIIIGHHPHVLKGIEVYRGKAIVYSLGNFAIDPPGAFQKDLSTTRGFKEISALNPNWRGTGDKMMLSDSCKTMAIKCTLRNSQLAQVSVLPAFIDNDSRPMFLHGKDARFAEIENYLHELNRAEQLATCLVRVGDELRVETN